MTDEDTVKNWKFLCGAPRQATSACRCKMAVYTDKSRNIINISRNLEVKEFMKIKTLRVCDE